MTTAARHEFEFYRNIPRTCVCVWVWGRRRWVLSKDRGRLPLAHGGHPVIWIALIPAFWALIIVHYCWASHRFWRATPAPPRPPSSTCTWCQVRPEGMCTCTSKCGQINCIGDHTSMAVFSDEDWGELQKLLREGHE
jgi:hypothetical protein